MFPGEADAPVNLDVRRGDVEVSLRTVGLGEAGDQRQIGGAVRRRPGRAVSGGPGGLDLEQHVRTHVLDRLEAADRPTELMPDLCVRHRYVQATLRPADLLRSQREHATTNRLNHDLRGRT